MWVYKACLDKQSSTLFIVDMVEKLKIVLCSFLYSNKLNFIGINQEEDYTGRRTFFRALVLTTIYFF